MIYKQWSHFALQILHYSLRNNRENSQKKSYSTITINTSFKIPSIFIIFNKPQPQVHCLQQQQCLHCLLCTFRAIVTPIYWITATSTTKPNVCNSYLPLTNVYLIIFHLHLFHHTHSFNIQTFLVRQLSLLRLTTVKKKSKTRSSSHW